MINIEEKIPVRNVLTLLTRGLLTVAAGTVGVCMCRCVSVFVCFCNVECWCKPTDCFPHACVYFDGICRSVTVTYYVYGNQPDALFVLNLLN
jgi:hypothetical protein